MSARPRALDCSIGVGAAYAARLLADVGWDVVKYEPPSGDPLRRQQSRWGGGEGGAFTFVNAGKRAVTADQPTLHALAAAADVVIGDFSPAALAESGLPADAYATLSPRLVVTSVSAFGVAGPRANWAATELIIQAASGLMFLTGEFDQPPMQLPPYQGALTGGVAAAAATLAAVRSSRRDGALRHTDVSSVEALAGNTFPQLSAYAYRGEVARREARLKGGLRMVPASDGFVYCAPGAVASMRMDGIAILLDEPRLAEPRFQTAEGRMENYDDFVALFVPPFRKKTAQEWFVAAEAMHMTFALVQTVDDLFACPQLAARELLHDVEAPSGATVRIPGRPFRLENGPPLPPPTAPRTPGVDTDEVLAEWLGR
jgi:crotonobetainyl-CoA:carnitine CoA-transferase CaiB-like acyl-CoA transferase